MINSKIIVIALEADITHPQSKLYRIQLSTKNIKKSYLEVFVAYVRDLKLKVSDNTIAAEGLQDFFKFVSKTAKNLGKK